MIRDMKCKVLDSSTKTTEYVWFCPETDELLVMEAGPNEGFEDKAHTIRVSYDDFDVMDFAQAVFFIGEV